MTKKRILVTGASGCIGHYITEALIQNTNYELYLLVRNPDKLQIDTTVRPDITVIQGDMQEIGKFSNLLKTIDIAVLTATSWGGEGIFDINVFKTLELMSLLNPEKCEQVIYFSTASVLNNNNQPLKEAGEIGTDYIRSKYDCLHQIEKLAIFPKITTVFPTLVLGGDDKNLIRFLQADSSFHFIHGKDIATVIQYLIDYPPQQGDPRRFVLGQSALTANQAIEEVCAYLSKKIYFRIPLSIGLANVIIAIFRIQMAAWDRFCMNYRHFSYAHAINPSSFNLPNYCVTMTDVLKISGVKAGI